MMHSNRIYSNVIRRVVTTSRPGLSLSVKPLGAQFRSFSDAPKDNNIPNIDSSSVVSDTTSNSMSSLIDNLSSVVDEKVVDAALAVGEPGMFSGKIMALIDLLHTTLDVPYWGAIIGTTIFTRICLLPFAIKTMQSTSRLSIMRPHLQRITDNMKNDPNISDLSVKLRYQAEAKALFAKYKTNPIRAMMWPLTQFPVFIAFFFALREMGLYYPDLATGGAFWFQNLALSDPLYILPIINAVSFLLMIEMGQDDVQIENKQQFKNIMRGLAVIMIPATLSMPSSLFIYWGTNNFISVFQTKLLKTAKVREIFDIPTPPKPEETPNLKVKSPIETIKEMIAAETKRREDAQIEIIDGKVKPTGPAVPPPPTFDAPPKKANTL